MTAPIVAHGRCRFCGEHRIETPWDDGDLWRCANCGVINERLWKCVQIGQAVDVGAYDEAVRLLRVNA